MTTATTNEHDTAIGTALRFAPTARTVAQDCAARLRPVHNAQGRPLALWAVLVALRCAVVAIPVYAIALVAMQVA